VAAVRASGAGKVKVACSDIDGILRGKYLHKDKFFGAVDGGFGFCDVVFGWDSSTCATTTHQSPAGSTAFPDALARLDLGTARRVPWDGDVPFFLGEFVNADGTPFAGVPAADAEARAQARREAGRAAHGRHGVRVVQLQGNARQLGCQAGRGPADLTPGMFGYSLLRMNENREFFNALMDQMAAFGVPIEGLHTETGPGVYEAAIAFSEALEQADRAILFKTGAKEIGQQLRHHAQLHGQVEPGLPGLQRAHPPEPVRRQEQPVLRREEPRRMSKLFESYLAGQVACMMDFAPLIWPTINSYKRLVDGFWAPVKPTWGLDNRTASFRVIAGSPKATRLETRCPGADVNPYLAMAAVIAAGLHGVEKGLKLTAPPITGTNQGAEHIPRAPRTLIETTRVFKDSAIARDWLGDTFVDHFAATREWEWRQWLDGVTDWELKRYFEII
jgi:glutamine synthetase